MFQEFVWSFPGGVFDGSPPVALFPHSGGFDIVKEDGTVVDGNRTVPSPGDQIVARGARSATGVCVCRQAVQYELVRNWDPIPLIRVTVMWSS